MRATCDAKDLAAGLRIVKRAVARRSSLPILGHVLLEVSGDKLQGVHAAERFALVERRLWDIDIDEVHCDGGGATRFPGAVGERSGEGFELGVGRIGKRGGSLPGVSLEKRIRDCRDVKIQGAVPP